MSFTAPASFLILEKFAHMFDKIHAVFDLQIEHPCYNKIIEHAF